MAGDKNYVVAWDDNQIEVEDGTTVKAVIDGTTIEFQSGKPAKVTMADSTIEFQEDGIQITKGDAVYKYNSDGSYKDGGDGASVATELYNTQMTAFEDCLDKMNVTDYRVTWNDGTVVTMQDGQPTGATFADESTIDLIADGVKITANGQTYEFNRQGEYTGEGNRDEAIKAFNTNMEALEGYLATISGNDNETVIDNEHGNDEDLGSPYLSHPDMEATTTDMVSIDNANQGNTGNSGYNDGNLISALAGSMLNTNYDNNQEDNSFLKWLMHGDREKMEQAMATVLALFIALAKESEHYRREHYRRGRPILPPHRNHHGRY